MASNILKLIFTHDRPEMLKSILGEVKSDSVVFDKDPYWDGKKFFYLKFSTAIEYALKSNYDWFLFMPDDISNINFSFFDAVTQQEWEHHLVAINILNDGRESCWGHHRTGQKNFKIGDVELKEVGFVDCGFMVNRFTLRHLKIDEPPVWWWDRPDKSSSVGWQTTNQFRKLGVKMMMPVKSLAFHGDHESVMHGEHRKQTPLITN
jgi:hypothetical protein